MEDQDRNKSSERNEMGMYRTARDLKSRDGRGPRQCALDYGPGRRRRVTNRGAWAPLPQKWPGCRIQHDEPWHSCHKRVRVYQTKWDVPWRSCRVICLVHVQILHYLGFGNINSVFEDALKTVTLRNRNSPRSWFWIDVIFDLRRFLLYNLWVYGIIRLDS